LAEAKKALGEKTALRRIKTWALWYNKPTPGAKMEILAYAASILDTCRLS
jgi:hypothetical protein